MKKGSGDLGCIVIVFKQTTEPVLAQQMDEAKLAGQEGKFYKMRTLLDAIIRQARQK